MYFYEPNNECCDCELKDAALTDIKYWFKRVVDQLYATDKLNTEDLENCLDELAYQLQAKIPEHAIQISRSYQEKIIPIEMAAEMNLWKKWNTQFLKDLTQPVL